MSRYKKIKTKNNFIMLLSLLVFIILMAVVAFSVNVNYDEKKEFLTSYSSCFIDLKNEKIHLVVENCTNVGTFSLGGFFNERWEKLTFLYPTPWEGSFMTIKIDEKIYSNSFLSLNSTHLDSYLIEKPSVVVKNEIVTRWSISEEKIFFEMIFSLLGNGTKIKLIARNLDNKEHKISFRIHFDTMVGENDGAPIYIPGDGLITQEKEYSLINFDYWKAYDRKEFPGIISTGILSATAADRTFLTKPEKLTVANWRESTHSSWDYKANEKISILGDSAVLLYFKEKSLAPQEEIEVATFYGIGEPILPEKKDFGIAEILSLKREVCPNEFSEIQVDVLNKGFEREGSLEIKIKNFSGSIIYSETKETGLIKKDSIAKVEFNFSSPSKGYPLDIEATLFEKEKILDKKIKIKFINLKKDCAPEEEKLDFLYIIILLLLLGITLAIIFYSLRFKKKGVLFEKIVFADGTVKVVVVNQTHKSLKNVVLEDKIPEDIEITVSTLNVKRAHNLLTWNLENLKPYDEATLEYKIKSPIAIEKLQEAKLKFNLEKEGILSKVVVIQE